MPLTILFHFLCAQHVSDINISVLQASACNTDTTPTQPHRNSNTHRTKKNTTNVVIQQNSRKLLMMDILMSETCWAHKKWNKIVSGIKLAFYSSTNCRVATRRNANTSHDYIPLTQMCINILKVKFHYIGLRSQSGYLLECLLLKSLSNITAPLKSKYISQHSAWWSVIVVVKKFRNLYKHETLYSFK